VTVEEAREKFKRLPSEIKLSPHFSTPPVSRNFDLYYSYYNYKKQTLHLNHFERSMKDDKDGVHNYIEVDGCYLSVRGDEIIPFNILLEEWIIYDSDYQTFAANQKQKDSFKIGLSKDQYSLLFEKVEVETKVKQAR